jgi:hypothetical protein
MSKPRITLAQARAAARAVKKHRKPMSKVRYRELAEKYLGRFGEDAQPETILDEALRITGGARPKKYGTPLENHSRTAALLSVYLSVRYPGIEITPRDICMFNILQKVSRDMFSENRDNLVDIAGYAQNAGAIADALAKK